MEFRADLHCHSTCSDGTLPPQEIVALAIEKGLTGLAITDHDTVDAYTLTLPAANQAGLSLISGVEFSAAYQGTSVHILAYSFSVQSPGILNFCQRHRERRNTRNRAILELLTSQGMPLKEEDLHDSDLPKQIIGRPHIAVAMRKKGYVASIQEAFNKYIGEGMPGYTPGSSFSIEETLHVIHEAKGFAIIAHPHLIKDIKLVKNLLSMPFDGIEGYYARFPLSEQERWVKIGERRNWLITGGSDFHGTIKPTIPLGCSWVNEETFKVLNDRFQQNQIV